MTMDAAYTNLTRHPDRYGWTPPEKAFELPGFVESGVTYESHTFWVEFSTDKWRDISRPEATIWVRHGGGVESIMVRHMFARPLRSLIFANDLRSAFKLCWGVHELAREAFDAGRSQANRDIAQAYVEGRYKKRKDRGAESFKVWTDLNPDSREPQRRYETRVRYQ